MKKVMMIAVLPVLLCAEMITGVVTDVTDGDTFKMSVDGTEKKVRFWGVDAPEKRGGQPYANASMWFVKDHCEGDTVRVKIHDTDRYGRYVGEIYVPGKEKSLNELLCLHGFAWWYEYYAPDATHLEAAQETARAEKRGLWGGRREPVNPYRWRKGER